MIVRMRRKLVVSGKEHECVTTAGADCDPGCPHKVHISCKLFGVTLRRLRGSWTFDRCDDCLRAEREAE